MAEKSFAAVALRAGGAECFTRGGRDRHRHLRGVAGLDDERQVLVREVDREPWRSMSPFRTFAGHAILSWPFVAVVP